VQAIQRMMKDGIQPEQVTDDLVSQYLYTVGVPDPDLIIRTSGELRVSNFLIWQGAYAELYSTPTYWPDFDKEEYRRALETFAHRERRYGGVSEAVASKSHVRRSHRPDPARRCQLSTSGISYFIRHPSWGSPPGIRDISRRGFNRR
jgi:hypothetical protein